MKGSFFVRAPHSAGLRAVAQSLLEHHRPLFEADGRYCHGHSLPLFAAVPIALEALAEERQGPLMRALIHQ